MYVRVDEGESVQTGFDDQGVFRQVAEQRAPTNREIGQKVTDSHNSTSLLNINRDTHTHTERDDTANMLGYCCDMRLLGA